MAAEIFGKFLKANGFGTGTAPSVAHHNNLYVGSDDGNLYAIGRFDPNGTSPIRSP